MLTVVIYSIKNLCIGFRPEKMERGRIRKGGKQINHGEVNKMLFFQKFFLA